MDADEHVLARGILGRDVVGVVGEHQGNAYLLRQGDEVLIQGDQLRQVLVPLELQEEIGEGLLVPARSLLRLLQEPLKDEAGDLAVAAAGEDYQPLAVCLQQLPVHPGFVVEALQVRLGDQLDQVVIPLIALGQDGEVVGALIGVPLVVAGNAGPRTARTR